MHAMHARKPKNFVLEERLERYADALEVSPASYAGCWAHAAHPLESGKPSRAYREVRLDLGCGKGMFTVEAARREPGVLFLGVDCEPVCMAYAAQRALEQGVRNALFIPGTGSSITRYFGPGEISVIYLNFSTPFPRLQDASQRLTTAEHLMGYRAFLAPGAAICLRTDSQPFRDYSRAELLRAGFGISWESDDARASRPGTPASEYELRLAQMGARVLALDAVMGPAPADFTPRPAPSLMDFLPEDLESMDYIPHGMQAAVHNLINRRAKRRKKEQAQDRAQQ